MSRDKASRRNGSPFGFTFIAPLVLGSVLNPINSTMLATALGVDFDPNVSYDERKDVWKLSDKIVTTRNITQSAIGDRDGLWTTVVTAAVFVNLPEKQAG